MAEGETEAGSRAASALTAARMYYLQDMTMDAIAAELRLSRSSVSRLLSHARATGLVEITVHSPLDAVTELERAVQKRYRVSAHVVPVPDSTSDIDRLERVAMTAAHVLTGFVGSNMIIGVAWGSTTSAIARHVVAKETHDTTIVQLNGAGNTRTTGIGYASEILQHFGEAYRAQVQQFPVPAFFDDPATKQALWRERSTRRVLDMQARMDVAVFGLGSPFAEVPSHVYIGGYLDAADFRSLAADHVVGDIATSFYRADGSSQDVALNARATGPDLRRLRTVSRRVCVVSGASKAPSVRGALNARLVTDLVLDEALARALLETPTAES